ncbi:hypothetical protein MTO96_006427 [Rhipicephalus appendiculatus]
MANYWDPLAYAHEQPSQQCTVRAKRDLAEFNAHPPPGIFVAAEENDVTKVHAITVGPVGTPYEGGFFQFLLKFPTDYPMSPPRLRHVTTDAGRVLFNQHFYRSGEVCLSILGTTSGPAWSPAQTLSSVLSPGESDRYNEFIRHETVRVTVCDQVEASLKETIECPPSLSSNILKSFLESYGKYEDAVTAKLHLTGRQMKDPYTKTVSKYEYETLLTRLKSLKEQVEKKNEEAAKAAAEAAAQEENQVQLAK